MRFLDADFKAAQVDLAQGALGEAAVALGAVGLLVVAGKVLGRGGNADALNAAHFGGGDLAGDERVLAEVLEVSAANGVSVDVERGRQPDAEAVFLDLECGGAAELTDEFGVPGAGDQRGAGPCRGGNAAAGGDAQTRRAVRGHHGGNAESVNAADAAGVGEAAARNAADDGHELLVGELVDEFVHGNAAEIHVSQLHGLFAVGGYGRVFCGDDVVVGADLKGGQFFKTAVGLQAFFQLVRRALTAELFGDAKRLFHYEAPRDLLQVAAAVADEEGVFTALQEEGGRLQFAEVVVACHALCIERDGDLFAFARLQQASLVKAREGNAALAEHTLRRAVIDLHHFLAGALAGVGNGEGKFDFVAVSVRCDFGEGEGRVRQTVAEGIDDLVARAGDGLKVAVTHVDVLEVADVVEAFVEGVRKGVVGEVFCKGVGQLAGRVCVSAEDVCQGDPALHARLPAEQGGVDLRVFLDPRDVHHAADVEHGDAFVKGGGDFLHHALFHVAQVEVALFARAVGPLAGEAVDADDRHVRVFRGRAHEFVGQLLLLKERDAAVGGQLRLDEVVVVTRDGLVDVHLVFFEHQPVVEVVNVLGEHAAAAAAALNVVQTADAEKCHGTALLQRESSAVFQKHRALARGAAGELHVLFRARDTSPVLTEAGGQVVAVTRPSLFLHFCDLSCDVHRCPPKVRFVSL